MTRLDPAPLAAAMPPAPLVAVGQMAPPFAHGLAMVAFDAAVGTGLAVGLLAGGRIPGPWGHGASLAVGGTGAKVAAVLALFPPLRAVGRAG